MTAATLDTIVKGNAKKGGVLGAQDLASYGGQTHPRACPAVIHLVLTKVTVDIETDKSLPGCVVRCHQE